MSAGCHADPEILVRPAQHLPGATAVEQDGLRSPAAIRARQWQRHVCHCVHVERNTDGVIADLDIGSSDLGAARYAVRRLEQSLLELA